jgi:hypothetical protein
MTLLSTGKRYVFEVILVQGFTVNQISGDSVSGFNYWGYTGGLGTYFMLSDKTICQYGN